MNWEDAIRIGMFLVELTIFSFIGISIIYAVLTGLERRR